MNSYQDQQNQIKVRDKNYQEVVQELPGSRPADPFDDFLKQFEADKRLHAEEKRRRDDESLKNALEAEEKERRQREKAKKDEAFKLVENIGSSQSTHGRWNRTPAAPKTPNEQLPWRKYVVGPDHNQEDKVEKLVRKRKQDAGETVEEFYPNEEIEKLPKAERLRLALDLCMFGNVSIKEASKTYHIPYRQLSGQAYNAKSQRPGWAGVHRQRSQRRQESSAILAEIEREKNEKNEKALARAQAEEADFLKRVQEIRQKASTSLARLGIMPLQTPEGFRLHDSDFAKYLKEATDEALNCPAKLVWQIAEIYGIPKPTLEKELSKIGQMIRPGCGYTTQDVLLGLRDHCEGLGTIKGLAAKRGIPRSTLGGQTERIKHLTDDPQQIGKNYTDEQNFAMILAMKDFQDGKGPLQKLATKHNVPHDALQARIQSLVNKGTLRAPVSTTTGPTVALPTGLVTLPPNAVPAQLVPIVPSAGSAVANPSAPGGQISTAGIIPPTHTGWFVPATSSPQVPGGQGRQPLPATPQGVVKQVLVINNPGQQPIPSPYGQAPGAAQRILPQSPSVAQGVATLPVTPQLQPMQVVPDQTPVRTPQGQSRDLISPLTRQWMDAPLVEALTGVDSGRMTVQTASNAYKIPEGVLNNELEKQRRKRKLETHEVQEEPVAKRFTPLQNAWPVTQESSTLTQALNKLSTAGGQTPTNVAMPQSQTYSTQQPDTPKTSLRSSARLEGEQGGYTENDVEQALIDFEEGQGPLRKLARKYGVPIFTLRQKIKEKLGQL